MRFFPLLLVLALSLRVMAQPLPATMPPCTNGMVVKACHFLGPDPAASAWAAQFFRLQADEQEAVSRYHDPRLRSDCISRFLIAGFMRFGKADWAYYLLHDLHFTTEESLRAAEIYDAWCRLTEAERLRLDPKAQKEQALLHHIKQGEVIPANRLSAPAVLIPHADASALAGLPCLASGRCTLTVEVRADRQVRLVEGDPQLFNALHLQAASAAQVRLDLLGSTHDCTSRADITLAADTDYVGFTRFPVYWSKKQGWHLTPKSYAFVRDTSPTAQTTLLSRHANEVDALLAAKVPNGQREAMCRMQVCRPQLHLYLRDRLYHTYHLDETIRLDGV